MTIFDEFGIFSTFLFLEVVKLAYLINSRYTAANVGILLQKKKIRDALKKFSGNFSLNLGKALENLWNFKINNTNVLK